MTPEDLTDIGLTLYGPQGWQTKLAQDLEVDYSTVKRWVSGATAIPGPARVALRLMLKIRTMEDGRGSARRPMPRSKKMSGTQN